MSKKIKAILIILLYVGLILINTKAYAISGKLLNETTRIRKEASTSSDVVDLISIGENFEIESEEGDWYKVKYKGKTGFIRKDMVEVEESSPAQEESQNTENAEPAKTQETQNNENNQETTNTENSNESSETAVSEDNKIQQEEKEENIVQKGFTGKITSNLDIKILPSICSSVIATVYNDTQIEVKDVINKWAYIETENISGWVLIGKINTAESSVEASSQENQEVQEDNKEQQEEKQEEVKEEAKTEEAKKEETKTVTKYVSTETLNMREKAENNAKVIKQLTLNAEVTVLETVDSTWSKIKHKSSTGYVANKYLSDTKTKVTSRSEEPSRQQEVKEETKKETTKTQETKKEEKSSKKEEKKETNESATASSGSGSSVVSYAKQFLGNPYVYGGTSLTNGCDCSGFVMGVYKHFGVSLPHSSGSMRSVGTAVDKSNLQAGDIVCFSGHVGIYIGGNNFIHAANPSKGIIISSLSESYYKSKYICARRV